MAYAKNRRAGGANNATLRSVGLRGKRRRFGAKQKATGGVLARARKRLAAVRDDEVYPGAKKRIAKGGITGAEARKIKDVWKRQGRPGGAGTRGRPQKPMPRALKEDPSGAGRGPAPRAVNTLTTGPGSQREGQSYQAVYDTDRKAFAHVYGKGKGAKRVYLSDEVRKKYGYRKPPGV